VPVEWDTVPPMRTHTRSAIICCPTRDSKGSLREF